MRAWLGWSDVATVAANARPADPNMYLKIPVGYVFIRTIDSLIARKSHESRALGERIRIMLNIFEVLGYCHHDSHYAHQALRYIICSLMPQVWKMPSSWSQNLLFQTFNSNFSWSQDICGILHTMHA
jgi:hypothetical protein